MRSCQLPANRHRQLISYLILSLTLCTHLCACSSTESTDQPEEGEKRMHAKAFTIPTAAPEDPNEDSWGSDELRIRILNAPDISARNRPSFDLSEKGYDPAKEPIKVQLLNYWDDGSNYFANINFKNTGRQLNKNIYIFGYDRLGRLVSTQVNNTFFRTQQNLVRTLRFSKRGQAVRWTILVKN